MNLAMNTKKKFFQISHEEISLMFSLIWPCILENMTATLVSLVDTAMVGSIGAVANILNVIGNFLLIYPSRKLSVLGHNVTIWGAGMGIKGAAIASALSIGCAGLFLILYMHTKHSALKISLSLREGLDFTMIQRVLKIALPAAAERVIINVGQIIYASMIASIGTAQVAAYHITCTIESLGYMPAKWRWRYTPPVDLQPDHYVGHPNRFLLDLRFLSGIRRLWNLLLYAYRSGCSKHDASDALPKRPLENSKCLNILY